MVPQNKTTAGKSESALKLLDILEDNDDVQNVYSIWMWTRHPGKFSSKEESGRIRMSAPAAPHPGIDPGTRLGYVYRPHWQVEVDLCECGVISAPARQP